MNETARPTVSSTRNSQLANPNVNRLTRSVDLRWHFLVAGWPGATCVGAKSWTGAKTVFEPSDGAVDPVRRDTRLVIEYGESRIRICELYLNLCRRLIWNFPVICFAFKCFACWRLILCIENEYLSRVRIGLFCIRML